MVFLCCSVRQVMGLCVIEIVPVGQEQCQLECEQAGFVFYSPALPVLNNLAWNKCAAWDGELLAASPPDCPCSVCGITSAVLGGLCMGANEAKVRGSISIWPTLLCSFVPCHGHKLYFFFSFLVSIWLGNACCSSQERQVGRRVRFPEPQGPYVPYSLVF